MTAVQTIQIRLSECRQRLNTLLQVETRSAEEQTEMETLTTEVGAKEPELRAAIASEPDPLEVVTTGDPEARELAQLTERSNVGAIILSAVTEKRHSLGAELELQQAHGLTARIRYRSTCFASSSGRRRRDGSGADERDGTSQAEIVQPVFANGAGAFLGYYSPGRRQRRCGLSGSVDSPGCWRAAQRLIGRTRKPTATFDADLLSS